MDARLISQGAETTAIGSSALVSVAEGAGQPQKNIKLGNFADSMAQAVPQKTKDQVSITGLYAKTTDGKMVELTSESVASVVAELANVNFGYNTFVDLVSGVIGMLGRGELKIDANGLYNTGFYSFVDPNQQYNLPIRSGVLIVIKVGTSGYTCLQICFNRTVTGESADKIFYRTADASNVWSDWGSLS